MSDHNDESTRRDPPKVVKFPQPVSITPEAEQILAEYGSRGGVPVEGSPTPKEENPAPGSPGATPSQSEDKPEEPSAFPEPESIPEIVPQGVGRNLAARLSTVLRRADHYADHMYDQAEEDEQTRRLEKYLPGVDKEQIGPQSRRTKPPKPKKEEEAPSDIPPAELAKELQAGLKSSRPRLLTAALLTVLMILFTLDLPYFNFSGLSGQLAQSGLTVFQLRSWVLTGLLAAVGLLCMEVLARGAQGLFTLHFRSESLTLLAFLFTIIDGATAGRLDLRGACLPCACVVAAGLSLSLWGLRARRQGDRFSAKAAARAESPYVVTLDENMWSGRPAYIKWTGASTHLGSQLQAEDCGEKVYRVAGPLLALGCVAAALLASVGQGVPGRFVWSASVCFTAASSWPSLLAYGIPYRKLAARLNGEGAALAGWPGVSRCVQAGVILTDLDLFPPGSIQVGELKPFHDISTETTAGYTATILRAARSGLARPFRDYLRTHNAFYRTATGVRCLEGGIMGTIRNQEVLVGTAAFMHLMEVQVPPGLNLKNALFCAIEGQLAGIFPLEYTMGPAIAPSLSALISSGVSPVLATRDPNLIPAMLEERFKLRTEKMEFPPVDRRLALSDPGQEHHPTPVAILSREGLTAYADAVIGARRLYLGVRRCLFFTLLGAVIGLLLTGYLSAMGAYASLTPVSFLIFMAAWLVPQLLITNWVVQY